MGKVGPEKHSEVHTESMEPPAPIYKASLREEEEEEGRGRLIVENPNDANLIF